MANDKFSRFQKTLGWLLRLLAAIILFQTLFFKFSGASESVYIFEAIGMEPIGRYGSGVVELIAVIFLLWNRWAWVGAVLGVGVISGAIFFHLTSLGIEVQQDGGLLFMLALIVFFSCLMLIYLYRNQIRDDLKSLRSGETATG